MVKIVIGTKKAMTQIFNDEGRVVPATIITTAPATIVQVKTTKRDGYSALQIGFGETNEKHVTKPEQGHFKKSGKLFAYTTEIRIPEEELSNYSVGDTIDPTVFAAGDSVFVTGTSKGKGFQGGVKRHGFAGGRRTHGQKHSEREPGSIGAGGMQRVLKGTRMAGRMGSDRVTVRNLSVVGVSADSIVIKGAIPGRPGSIVKVQETV